MVPVPDPDAERPCGCPQSEELQKRVDELFSALQDGRLLVEKLTHRIVQTRVFTPALRDEAEAWQKRTLEL